MDHQRHKIVYIGELTKGGTSCHRMEALIRIGHEVRGVERMARGLSKSRIANFNNRVGRRVLPSLAYRSLNREILEAVDSFTPSIVWIDKGVNVQPNTFDRIRAISQNVKIVGYFGDDMMNPANQSRWFWQSLSKYDVIFTTKSFNVTELEDLGARKVMFVDNSFDPFAHRPEELTMKDREAFGGSVGFIGAFEIERAASIRYLADNGVAVRIWGNGWQHVAPHPNLRIENKPVMDDVYRKTICAFDINLGFLRKINRDLQTNRTMEIPACGAFMLAERSKEHSRLFEEGKEAEFFASDQELLEKTRYYLDRPHERKKIATAGRHRCLSGGYSTDSRMAEMLQIVDRG